MSNVTQTLLRADARSIPLADGTVQCCMTSPPYWGLRLYEGVGDSGIGLEPTLDGYLENMRAVGRELWRVLRDDGTLWLNLGDCYNAGTSARRKASKNNDVGYWQNAGDMGDERVNVPGMKPKDLVGLPWRVAFALQADGWHLRSDIIWAKPNPMPESVRDRPTRSHEYLFLLTKSASYYCDMEAIREANAPSSSEWGETSARAHGDGQHAQGGKGLYRVGSVSNGRNRRTVWQIPTQPYRGAHFATFPEKLVEPCILAGTSPKACGVCGAPWERETKTTRTFESGSGRSGRMPSGKNGPGLQGGGETLDVRRGPVVHSETVGWRPTCEHNDARGSCLVLDPFCGSGTVGAVSRRFGRRFVGLDLSEKYLELARERIGAETLGMGL